MNREKMFHVEIEWQRFFGTIFILPSAALQQCEYGSALPLIAAEWTRTRWNSLKSVL